MYNLAARESIGKDECGPRCGDHLRPPDKTKTDHFYFLTDIQKLAQTLNYSYLGLAIKFKFQNLKGVS
jgi:hypothetical protein